MASLIQLTLTRSSINDSDDPFERMLAVLRFTFTKDLKYVVRLFQRLFMMIPHCLSQ